LFGSHRSHGMYARRDDQGGKKHLPVARRTLKNAQNTNCRQCDRRADGEGFMGLAEFPRSRRESHEEVLKFAGDHADRRSLGPPRRDDPLEG
jgi:hypothetical protein